MSNGKIAGGLVHDLPADLKNALLESPKALKAWENITPLARNEWICWTVTVRKSKTRNNHIERTVSELIGGKRRPCCWAGCFHRKKKQTIAIRRVAII